MPLSELDFFIGEVRDAIGVRSQESEALLISKRLMTISSRTDEQAVLPRLQVSAVGYESASIAIRQRQVEDSSC